MSREGHVNKDSSLTNTYVATHTHLNLKLKILSRHNVPKKVLIQYAIHYVKKNNEHSRKVFFIAEKTITKELHLDKKIPLKKVTTREHYPGDHYLDIQINGTLYQRKKFNLSL